LVGGLILDIFDAIFFWGKGGWGYGLLLEMACFHLSRTGLGTNTKFCA
jgi:hypothetical protein